MATSRPARILVALLALATAALVAGCRRSSSGGSPYACDCEMLTDTDGLSTVRVAVCEADPGLADRAARGCAQAGAPAQIQSCACRPNPDLQSCAVGSCKVEEHR